MDRIKKQDGFAAQKLYVLPPSLSDESSRHPLTRPLHMTDIGYFPHAGFHHRERPLGTDAYILIVCADGRGWFAAGSRKPASVGRGDVLMLPPHTGHAYGADDADPWSIYWLHVRGPHICHYIGGDPAEARHFSVSPDTAARIEDQFLECFRLLDHGYSLPSLIHLSQIVGYLLSIIFVVNGQQHGLKIGPQLTKDRMIQLMLDRLESSLTLQEIAAHVNLSVPHVSHLFKRDTGYSPIDYFLRLKIQRVCQHLELSDLTLKEIAARLGFADPYYLSRLFSKIMGVSPSQFRNRPKS